VSRRFDDTAASEQGPADHHDVVERSYDAIAGEYLRTFGDELTAKPLDRALLAMIAQQVGPAAPVGDVGCGPGHVAAFMAGQGTKTVGIDLSGQMVEVGRRNFPSVEFRQGDFLSLPAGDAEFAAVVALYSIIHLTTEELPAALREFRRVLRPSGLLLLAFHVGDEVHHRSEWFGREVELDFRFFEPTEVAELLEQSGFIVDVRLVRRHYPHEVETRRAYLLARATD